MSIPKYEPHPIALLLPPHTEAEKIEIRNSVKEYGFDRQRAIILYEGKILDGYDGRYLSCVEEGVEPVFEEYTGDQPLAFSMRMNLIGRHMTQSQLADVGARMVPMLREEAERRRQEEEPAPDDVQGEEASADGEESKTEEAFSGDIRDQAGEMVGVSGSLISKAVAVHEHGTEALQEMLRLGEIGATDAAKVAKLPKKTQAKVVRAFKESSTEGKNLLEQEENALQEVAPRTEPEANGKTRGRRAATQQTPEEETPKDAFGNDVPKRCRDALFDPWVQSTYDTICRLSEEFRKARIADGMNRRSKRFPFFNAKDFIDGAGFVIQYLDDLSSHLKEHRPSGVCPACGGKGCSECRSTGVVSRNLYKTLKDAVKEQANANS